MTAMTEPLRQRVGKLLLRFNLVMSRQRPFISRRYPYRGRGEMLKAIGPDLAQPTTWRRSEIPPRGELAEIFAETPNIAKWSHYFPIYESVLPRGRPVRMLEIGVDRGGSLRMWRRYLHPESVIVGIDINPECKKFDDPASRIYVRIGPQQDTDFLRRVNEEFGPFDVILDDGSHLNSHIIDTFRHLFPNALSKDGVYIVEDIHANYWTAFADIPMTFVDFTKWLMDAMHAHYQVTQGPSDFLEPQRRETVEVPVAARMLGKIEFHDSIAVIHRAERELPRIINQ
jgi:hypothetical protein